MFDQDLLNLEKLLDEVEEKLENDKGVFFERRAPIAVRIYHPKRTNVK